MAAAGIEAGQDALRRGAWDEARAGFEAALAEKESPEALEGAGTAARWLGDAAAAQAAHERAFRLYRERSDRLGAARTAALLAIDAYTFAGDTALATGWLERGRQLLEGAGASRELGWLDVLEGHVALLVRNDPDEAARLAREANAIGRELGDLDLELFALAQEGLVLVGEGRVDEGMRRLDAAAAAAVAGELTDVDAITTTCCYLIYACKRVRDFDRAAQWCERVQEISRRYGDRLTFAVCRAHYADVLLWRGAWAEAERELGLAAAELGAVSRAKIADAVVRLAELRRRQGRLDEAARLFRKAEGHPLAALGRGALALDRGSPSSAADLAERFLRRLPPGHAERVPGLELLVRTRAALGDVAGAGEALVELGAIAEALASEPVAASLRLAEGALAAAEGDLDRARRALEDAVDLFARSGAPFEAASARRELARVLRALGREDAAREEEQDAAAALRSLGSGAPAAGDDGLSPRELEILRLLANGRSNEEIARELVLSVRTVERHVSNIYAKLRLSGKVARAAAATYAASRGYV
jgi:ATP/maltotriose-dependent transcriptional regulator MalT